MRRRALAKCRAPPSGTAKCFADVLSILRIADRENSSNEE